MFGVEFVGQGNFLLLGRDRCHRVPLPCDRQSSFGRIFLRLSSLARREANFPQFNFGEPSGGHISWANSRSCVFVWCGAGFPGASNLRVRRHTGRVSNLGDRYAGKGAESSGGNCQNFEHRIVFQ